MAEIDSTNERMTFTYPQYCRAAKEYQLRLKRRSAPGHPPVYFCEASSRIDSQVLFYLWLDQARQVWIAFSEEEAQAEEIEEMFA